MTHFDPYASETGGYTADEPLACRLIGNMARHLMPPDRPLDDPAETYLERQKRAREDRACGFPPTAPCPHCGRREPDGLPPACPACEPEATAPGRYCDGCGRFDPAASTLYRHWTCDACREFE